MYGTESVMDSFSDTWAKAKDISGHIAATMFKVAHVMAFLMAAYAVGTVAA